MPTVFISYARHDSGLVGAAIVEPLRAHGLDVWIDQSQICVGENWEQQIRANMEACNWFLVALSPNSVSSDWVQAEVHWAIKNRKGRMIPVLIQACDPGMLHLMLPTLQCLDFTVDKNRALQQLLAFWGLLADDHKRFGSGVADPYSGPSLPFAPERPMALGSQFGRYRILDLLGCGGMSYVYRARDTELDREVAIKTLRHADPKAVERLMREARLHAKLNLAGVVAIYDIGRGYIVQEYLQGSSFALLIRQRASLEQLITILAATANVLHQAHQQGILHRDIKPENILIDRDGKPHLLDFGLCHEFDIPDTIDDGVPLPGCVVGTLPYISPEAAWGQSSKLDQRSDIWSLGVILYTILTDRLPFMGNGMETLRSILASDPLPPRQLNNDVPKELEVICMRCLSKLPSDRPDTAEEFSKALREYLLEPKRKTPWYRRFSR